MRCDQIGVGVSRQEFVDFLNSVHGGQFFVIKGYVNGQGEKSDQILRFGIKYGSIKERDVRLLGEVLAGRPMPTLTVTQGAYVPPSRLGPAMFRDEGEHLVRAAVSYDRAIGGATMRVIEEGFVDLLDVETFGNRKGNKKDGHNVPVTVSYELQASHPLVIAAIGDVDAQGTVLQGLVNPRESGVEYDKQAQSCYSLEKDGMSRWYLRDVLRVRKVVRVRGDYPFSATLPINAVKDAIRSQWLLTGKYRQFILTDGQFESVTIEGQAVLCDGVDEQFYFALPEAVKGAIAAESVESVNAGE
jgi:hypothetical protein